MKEGKSVDHLVSAHELSVRDHMEVQRLVQKHVDNACSKTINIAADCPIEEVEKAWLEYLPSLKGVTFYRENTRGFVRADGTIEEPPLKALSLKEGIKRFEEKEVHTVMTETLTDCASGACEVKWTTK
jgi:ribonucleotide reductase alpha subunit